MRIFRSVVLASAGTLLARAMLAVYLSHKPELWASSDEGAVRLARLHPRFASAVGRKLADITLAPLLGWGATMPLDTTQQDALLDVWEQVKSLATSWEQQEASKRDGNLKDEPCYQKGLGQLGECVEKARDLGVSEETLQGILADSLPITLAERFWVHL